MLGGIGNIMELMKNARAMQDRVAEMQREIASRRFDAETGGGAVRITVDGKGIVLAVKIDPQAVTDVDLLEDLIASAVNSAVCQAHDAMRAELTKLTGGLNIPGLEGMLGGAGS